MDKGRVRQKIEIHRRVLLGCNSVGESLYREELLCKCWAHVGDGWATVRFHPGIARGQSVLIGEKTLMVRRITEIPSRHRILKLHFKSDASDDASRESAHQSWQRFRASHE